ncbi:hypothetical protein BG015_010193 [Linnemannia schmuckeri]|uniref:Uncharacterized protein n=1 Tax=Linnemannia schmuckeri TaxID=64567 RepID=A0A9P5S8V8_9FUNG|nr:hypothetical protein BG015_010193 [Linnemannia schmuckeri]
MDSQPYDGFEDVYNVSSRYSNEANDFNDNVDKGILVADDSLAVASGEALSWSVSPQRAEQANSAEEDKQEDHQSDQDDIVVSTYHDRRFKYHTQPQAPFEAAAAEEEEEGAELRAEPLSPEVDSEFEDHVESYYRKPAPSASQTSVGTRDALTSNIKDSSSKSKATATAEKQTRNRRAQQPVLTLVPAAITPTRTPRRRSIPDDVKRQLNKDAIDLLLQNPHMNSVFLSVDIPVLPEYSEYRKKITATPEAEAEDSGRKRGAQDEEELQEDAGSDGYEDRRTTPSIHYQSVHRHLLPPKKRIRTLVSFQENQASESWPARRGRLRIVPISGSDSSSDAGLVVRNGRRKNFGRRKRLSSTPLPSAEEQEQEEEGIVAESSESSPSPQEISPRVLDEAEGNNTQDEGGEQHRELTKLRRAWKEHGIHWPLQTATAVVNVTSSHRLRGSTPEEYSTNFVFGSALPLPR